MQTMPNYANKSGRGLQRILTDNRLFGDDLGEFAGNQALLDLPKWLTDEVCELPR
jgi:hypothetical protein